jgi:hypothetical protein
MAKQILSVKTLGAIYEMCSLSDALQHGVFQTEGHIELVNDNDLA